MQNALLNRNDILKNFAIGFIPIFVFIIADEFWGTEVSLMVAVATGLLYLVYYLLRYRRLEKMILLDTGLIVLMGGISIAMHNALFFKLKPALIEAILVVLLGIHAFSSRPVLLQMSRRYMGSMELPPQQIAMMKQMSRVLFVVFTIHTVLIVYAAYFWSEGAWAFISGGLFYILFVLILIGQWLYMRFYRKPVPLRSEMQGPSDDELLDLVDEHGRVIGQTTRSAAHGNPNLLHPVVHLHIFNKNGMLFLQKRSAKKDLYPGFWDTAVGGHVSAGEDISQALLRETREELGIKPGQPRMLFRYIMRNEYESELVHAFSITHNGPFKINRDEIEIGRFWTAFEIRRMLGQGVFTPNFEQEFTLLEQLKLI